MEELLGLTEPFGQGAARALDVRPRSGVTAIQEQRARPDVDRLLVLGGEVMVETEEEKLLDLRLAARLRRAVERTGGISAKRIRHR